MQTEAAIQLIAHPSLQSDRPQRWVDLGSGDGSFTLALARLLPPHSQILAIDRQAKALRQIPAQLGKVLIDTRVGDFLSLDWPDSLDGILMANSLHYVADQEAFLRQAKHKLAPEGALLFVEYDTDRGNPWVPYPLSYLRLAGLCQNAGFGPLEKIAERSSLYQRANLYGAWVSVLKTYP